MTSNDRPPHGRNEATTTTRRLFREGLLIGLLALTLNLAGNGRVGLWDRDEPRYAGCTREMRLSGDWIHPTFNAEPRYHKPVLIYWLMLAGTALGGDNPFGARLVSAVAGAATCLLVWACGRRMLGARAGLLAGLILATTPIVVAESKLATTDATLMLWVAGCQFALWELAQRPSRGAAAVFWTLLGLAILTKSPAGPVLIAASAAVSWWWGGPTRCWARLRWRWGPLLCAAIVLPWNVAILVRSGGAYYHVAVGYHIIQRATSGIEEHGGFPGYYLVLGLLTCLPWAALLPSALVSAWRRRRESPAFGFLLGWVVGPLLLLECVRTKLIHYYLPAYPAWALLIAWLIVAVSESGVRLSGWPAGRSALRALAVSGVVVVVGLVVVAGLAPGPLRAPLLALAGVTALGAIGTAVAQRRGAVERSARWLIATSAAFVFLGGAWLLPAVAPYRLSGRVAQGLANLETTERLTPVLCGCQLPGIVYDLGHPAPVIRSRADLYDRVDQEGAVVSALLPHEVRALRNDPRVSLEVREAVSGLNIEKARTETVHLTVIRSGRLAASIDDRPTRVR